MTNSDVSSERVEAEQNLNSVPHRWGPPLVTPWRAYDQQLLIIYIKISLFWQL
jgi:hypothetical protein